MEMSVLAPIVLAMAFLVSIDAEVVNRSQDNELGFQPPMITIYYKFGSKMANYWRNRLQAVSEEHKDLVFAASDADEYMSRFHDFGFEFDFRKKLETEPIVVAEDQNLVRYLFDAKLTTDSLMTFVKRFKNKDLIAHIKSEPIPENTGSPVKQVVGKTFKEMVIDNPKDVFILMYAPWCGHCKEVLPIWQKLGHRLAQEPNIDILQIDVTQNEVHRPFKTMNYPTLYWLSANDKYSPKKFMGQRTVPKFIEYVSKMATKPLLKYDREGKPIKESDHKSQIKQKSEL